jgi:hypothetical protein
LKISNVDYLLFEKKVVLAYEALLGHDSADAS